MSKVDVELENVKEILAAAKVEENARQLMHDWQREQIGNIQTNVIPQYIEKFNKEIKAQKDGDEIAKNFVSETMIKFIASVMVEITARTICEKIRILSDIIAQLTIDNHRINEHYAVLPPGKKVIVDIDTFFNTAKMNMATPLLNELEILAPKKPKNKKPDDGCVISGGSKGRIKPKKSMKRKSRKSRKLRTLKKRALK